MNVTVITVVLSLEDTPLVMGRGRRPRREWTQLDVTNIDDAEFYPSAPQVSAAQNLEDTCRKAMQQIINVSSKEELLAILDILNPADIDYDPNTWSDILQWCKAAPVLAFAQRNCLLNGDVNTMKNMAHSTIINIVERVSFPQTGTEVYRMMNGSIDKLNEWIVKASLENNGKNILEEHLGIKITEETVSNNCMPSLNFAYNGIRAVDNNFSDRFARKNTMMQFTLIVAKGGEAMVDAVLKKLVDHNTALSPLPENPRYSTYVVVTKTGCDLWDPSNALPKQTVMMSESAMPLFIGKGGRNIKQFNKDEDIRNGGIRPYCFTRDPTLPVIFFAPFFLDERRHAALLEYIKHTEETSRYSYDEDDDLFW